MNTLSWNCQGLGNPWSVRALCDMVQRWCPKLVFLMETKAGMSRMRRIMVKIGLLNGVIVSSKERSGGIAMLWENGSNCGA